MNKKAEYIKKKKENRAKSFYQIDSKTGQVLFNPKLVTNFSNAANNGVKTVRE